MKRFKWWLLLMLIAAACDDSGAGPDDDDDPVPTDELAFVRFTAGTAPAVRQASFWAVKGEHRELEIEYTDGEDFLEFDVGGNSLLRRPDGSTFQDGDSVLITVTLDPSDRYIMHFEPSGLVFAPNAPAELEISYAKGKRDIDEDGDEDERDRSLERKLRIWKQEAANRPWIPQSTVRIDDDELRAKITSFTGFSMASNRTLR